MKTETQRTREDIKAKLNSAYGMMVSRQYDDTDSVKLRSEYRAMYDAIEDNTPYYHVLEDILKVVSVLREGAWIDVYSFMDKYKCFTAMGDDERTSTYKVFSAIASGYAQILVREDMEKEMGDTIPSDQIREMSEAQDKEE